MLHYSSCALISEYLFHFYSFIYIFFTYLSFHAGTWVSGIFRNSPAIVAGEQKSSTITPACINERTHAHTPQIFLNISLRRFLEVQLILQVLASPYGVSIREESPSCSDSIFQHNRSFKQDAKMHSSIMRLHFKLWRKYKGRMFVCCTSDYYFERMATYNFSLKCL